MIPAWVSIKLNLPDGYPIDQLDDLLDEIIAVVKSDNGVQLAGVGHDYRPLTERKEPCPN